MALISCFMMTFAIMMITIFSLSSIHAITLPSVAPTESIQSAQPECGFYLAPSTLADGIGRGVFAGKNFTKDEKMDTMISVTIPYGESGCVCVCVYECIAGCDACGALYVF